MNYSYLLQSLKIPNDVINIVNPFYRDGNISSCIDETIPYVIENYDIQPGDAFEAKLIPGTKSWLPGFEDSVQGAHGHQPKYKQGHRQSVAATSMPTCKFHVLGTCDKGFNCRFSHSLGDRNVGGISTGSNDETASSNATKLPIITDEMLEEWCENG